MSDEDKAKRGFWIVLAGLGVVLGAFVACAFKCTGTDFAAAVGALATVIGTLVGTYFGVQAGADGKEAIERKRAQLDEQVRELALAAPEPFKKLRADRPDLFKYP